MATVSAILSSRIPSGAPIQDFDVVVVDGRSLLACVDSAGRVFTWEPLADQWAEYRLDVPWRPEDEYDFIDISRIGAVVVDGRIVVGGGGEHQGFAQWDLETGAVRTFARASHSGVGRVVTTELDGQLLFVTGDIGSPRVELWDASRRDHAEERGPAADPVLLNGDFDCRGLAAGMLRDRPVVVTGDGNGGIIVLDVRQQEVFRQFRWLNLPIMGAGLSIVDGKECVVRAGGRTVMLGDVETGEWIDSLGDSPDDYDEDDYDNDIKRLHVGVVGDRPVAASGSGDGTVHIWDLETRSLIGGPLTEHRKEVVAVQVTELDGRSVVISAARDGVMRVWGLGA